MRKPDYKVTVIPVNNGIIVEIGCKTLVYRNRDYDTFFNLFKRYLNGEQDQLRKELFPDEADTNSYIGQEVIQAKVPQSQPQRHNQ